MSNPKLTYFDFPGGRGEECRLALHVAGVAFEDDRIPGKTWSERKADTPFGKLPVLTIDGKGSLAQSNVILRFVGHNHGLHPQDSWEAARHESVMEAAEDLRAEITTSSKIADADEQREARQGYVGSWAANIEKQVRGPFVGGEAIGVADLKLFNVLNWFKRGGVDHVPGTFFDAYPRLSGLFDAVQAHERVVDWYAK